jgi:hypothetical protein
VAIEKCHLCVGNGAFEKQVVEACVPVSAFGDVSDESVKVVTIGLNPALNEFFWNGVAKERRQRLAVLSDYGGVVTRDDLGEMDVEDAKRRCETYFKDSDRGWNSYFERMDGLLGRIHPAWTYVLGRAVHIDLVACGTRVRWGELPTGCQTEMLRNCRAHFVATLSRVPNGTMLLLDGARVICEIQKLGLGLELEGGEQLISIQGNLGSVGKMTVGGKKFPFRGWSTPVGKLTPFWRYDLAFWVFGTLRPKPPWSGFYPC